MLDIFLQSVRPGKVIAIEQEVRCSIGDDLPEFLGYIDLVEVTQPEPGKYTLTLVDFKTAAKNPGETLSEDQLLLYAWAAGQTGLLSEFRLPLSLRYDYMVKTKEPKCGTLTVEPNNRATQRVLAKIRECWRGMEAGIAYPCPGWQCAGCGYKSRCGKWPKEAS